MRRDRGGLERTLELLVIFVKMGFITFGGGYAMLPLIEEEVVNKKKWLDSEKMMEVFAVAQSLPGSLSINTSVLIGYEVAGIVGALGAVAGAAFPPFITITVIAAFFSRYESPLTDAAFMGVRCAVVALIWHAGVGTAKTSVIDKTSAALLILTIVLMLFTSLNPAVLILFAALLGVGSMLVRSWRDKKKRSLRG